MDQRKVDITEIEDFGIFV
uniref:Uncharacterized protein n=1 Tax=Arundo donax TaxID=35708 RepID=A0A0A9BF89_ARUDO